MTAFSYHTPHKNQTLELASGPNGNVYVRYIDKPHLCYSLAIWASQPDWFPAFDREIINEQLARLASLSMANGTRFQRMLITGEPIDYA